MIDREIDIRQQVHRERDTDRHTDRHTDRRTDTQRGGERMPIFRSSMMRTNSGMPVLVGLFCTILLSFVVHGGLFYHLRMPEVRVSVKRVLRVYSKSDLSVEKVTY